MSIANLEPKHFAVIAAMLVALGTQLGGMQHGWKDAITPGFVSGILIQIGTTIGAIYVGAPKQPWDGSLRRGSDDRAATQAAKETPKP